MPNIIVISLSLSLTLLISHVKWPWLIHITGVESACTHWRFDARGPQNPGGQAGGLTIVTSKEEGRAWVRCHNGPCR